LVIIWMIIARRLRETAGSALSFGRTKAKFHVDPNTGVTFEDVAGCDEAKLELVEVVDFLKNPQRYEQLGARIPKGVLLVGPPGTGKTLLARAIAGEAKVRFYSLSGSDFVEMFVGVGAARVRDLFQQACRNAPCIIFIDELDAIGRQRGANMGVANDEREQTLNQLLVELDGFEPNRGVIILAATNRPDVLDRALLRPGRFDRQVVLDAPDVHGRLRILELHLRNKPVESGLDLHEFARVTPGFSGADLANMVNEAALMAARRGGRTITHADLEEAVEKVLAGPQRNSRRLGVMERKRIAVHEVGHALVAHRCPNADSVHKISIIPRGHAALGYTLALPPTDRVLDTRSEILDRITAALGGRAAEELVFGEVSSGAENDLERATAWSRMMVARLGMGHEAGLVHWEPRTPDEAPFPLGGRRPYDYSSATAATVDREVKEILEMCYERALRILRENRSALDEVAEVLLETETLDRATFEQLVDVPANTGHGPGFEPSPASTIASSVEQSAEKAAPTSAFFIGLRDGPL
jgi:cell division protease FtsH